MKTIVLEGGKDAVLALHGLLGNPLELQYVGKRLHAKGYTVVIPLFPGYGHTVATADDGVASYERWLEQVEHWFDQLCAEYRSVSVIGLCIGAVLALQLAHKRGRQVAALALFSTTLAYDGWSIPRSSVLLPLVYYTPLRHRFSYHERFPYGLKNDKWRRWVAQQMKDSGSSAAGAARLSAEAIFQAHRLIRRTRQSLPHVVAPTLIIHADEDDVTSVKSADLVARRIGSKEKRKVILYNCYHMITMDNERDVVATETISFLERSLQPV